MPDDPDRHGGDGDGSPDGQGDDPLNSEWWIESFNATAWSTLKKRLQSTEERLWSVHRNVASQQAWWAMQGDGQQREGGRLW